MATKKASEEVIDVPAKKPRKKRAKKVETALEVTSQRQVSAEERGLSIQASSVVSPVVNTAQLAILTGSTPKHALRKRPGRGGMTFTYVPYGYVVDALNKAFGFDWDFKLLPYFNGDMFRLTTEELTDRSGRVTKTTRNITVYGELTIRIHSTKAPHSVITTIVKPGVGSQNWEQSIEFGDAVKGAKSDALKVAAHEVGIGLDLYYDDSYELNMYETRIAEEAAAAQKLAEEEAMALVSNVPTNGAILISRAMSDYKIGGDKLADILKVGLAEIVSAEPKQIADWWEDVKLHHDMSEGKNE